MVPLIDDSAPAAQCGGFIQFNSALFVLTFVTLETVSGLETRRGGYVGGGGGSSLVKEEEKVR